MEQSRLVDFIRCLPFYQKHQSDADEEAGMERTPPLWYIKNTRKENKNAVFVDRNASYVIKMILF
jgi:hypothetical protein